MRVRIGISDSREIELEVKDENSFRAEVEAAFSQESSRVLWVTDTKGRAVGIPADKIAYVEVETQDKRQSVGFSAD
ncbi:MAG TPA: DUF3107 domain-containing protein [Acidimicrobiia bacterium]|nr:DUF3107 domain-containing protein [Acidimicrobiia bacterium]